MLSNIDETWKNIRHNENIFVLRLKNPKEKIFLTLQDYKEGSNHDIE